MQYRQDFANPLFRYGPQVQHSGSCSIPARQNGGDAIPQAQTDRAAEMRQVIVIDDDSEPCSHCKAEHPVGECPQQQGGLEHCGLCSIAHLSVSRKCPQTATEVQLRLMLDSLKHSTEPKEHLAATKQLLKRELAERIRRKKLLG